MSEPIFIALIVFFGLVNLMYLTLTALSVPAVRRQRQLEKAGVDGRPVPAVSAIVTAYNEELVLRQSVLSLLGSDHPDFEVIVVNDGSEDRTLELACEAFNLERSERSFDAPVPSEAIRGLYRSRDFPNLWFIDKVNGGSGDAANAGLAVARHPYVAHFDADCILEPEALREAVERLEASGRDAIAVGGHVRVGNALAVEDGKVGQVPVPKRMVERFQMIEYLSAFMTVRVGWGLFNSMPVISGAFGMWRRDAVIAFGGFASEPTHFDIATTWRAHEYFRRQREPYRITHAATPTLWTQVPSTWRDLARQRKRWQRVVYEVLWIHRTMLFNPRYGVVGMVGMPYLFIYEAIGPFVELFSYAFVIYLAITGDLNLDLLILFLAVSFGLTAIVRVTGLLVDARYLHPYRVRTLVGLSVLAFFDPAIYHPALLLPRSYALYEFLRGRRQHDPSRRTAFAEIEERT